MFGVGNPNTAWSRNQSVSVCQYVYNKCHVCLHLYNANYMCVLGSWHEYHIKTANKYQSQEIPKVRYLIPFSLLHMQNLLEYTTVLKTKPKKVIQ